MILFEKIRLKNFLSIGNNFLEIELSKNPTTVFLGPSGSGKSCLLDALSFVLFNKPYRNISKPQLVNSINNKDCVVEIDFSVGEKQYFVRRGIKPNIFEIFRDGKLIGQDAHSRDYQTFFEEEILRFNYHSFIQIIVLGTSGYVPFMQLKPADRRIVIEELLGLQIFSQMNESLKLKITSVKDELLNNSYQQKLVSEKIKLCEDHQKELEKNIEEDRELFRQKIVEYNREIEQDNTWIKTATTTIDTLESNIESLRKNKLLTEKYKKLKEKFVQNKNKLDRQIQFYSENDVCPVCNQDINSEFKEKEIYDKQIKITELSAGLIKTEKAIIQLDKERAEIDAVNVKITDQKSKISSWKNDIKFKEELIKNAEFQLRKLDERQTSTIEDFQIDSLTSDLDQLRTAEKTFVEKKSLYDIVSGLLKDTGIKSQIIKNYLPVINKYINKYLQDMNFFVKFVFDENFDESIKSLGYENFVYGNFSEGERQRIDLAVLFTWRHVAQLKNSVNTNLLIMDEIFDSALDLNATENVVGLLSSDIFRNMNVFVISHKNQIKDKFTACLEFDKNKSFTRVI